ncbi:MAG TPA: type II toxin-antitoxin system RelE/ParE family toxin [Terricaulis sp.]|nr:type II toxin-antitoxin system RelE/ParE family toxin [Terricaulis sp.]
MAHTRETWSEQRAQTYVDSLFDMMEAFAAAPQRGRTADELSAGLRKQICGVHMIFYRKASDGVLIVRVLHTRMDAAFHLANDGAQD